MRFGLEILVNNLQGFSMTNSDGTWINSDYSTKAELQFLNFYICWSSDTKKLINIENFCRRKKLHFNKENLLRNLYNYKPTLDKGKESKKKLIQKIEEYND
jgi:hypothetical protein